MCFGGGSNASDLATAQLNAQAAATRQQQQQAEATREANLDAGKQSIDAAFAPFNDDYFSKYQQAQVDAATPQITDQYNVAKDKLFANLAGRGVQNSTIAGGAYNTLDKTRDEAQGAAANSAADAAQAFKNQVQGQKNNLYQLNASVGDPSQIATQAIGSSTALIPPRATTSLGDIFASVLSPLTKYASAAQYSPYGLNSGFGTVTPTSTARVVNS